MSYRLHRRRHRPVKPWWWRQLLRWGRWEPIGGKLMRYRRLKFVFVHGRRWRGRVWRSTPGEVAKVMIWLIMRRGGAGNMRWRPLLQNSENGGGGECACYCGNGKWGFLEEMKRKEWLRNGLGEDEMDKGVMAAIGDNWKGRSETSIGLPKWGLYVTPHVVFHPTATIRFLTILMGTRYFYGSVQWQI